MSASKIDRLYTALFSREYIRRKCAASFGGDIKKTLYSMMTIDVTNSKTSTNCISIYFRKGLVGWGYEKTGIEREGISWFYLSNKVSGNYSQTRTQQIWCVRDGKELR